jgi:uncharacterized protein YecE (DUF72 family)
LEFASRIFNSIEINGSFYSLQTPSSYQRWYDETPAGFVFSVKGPRFITHMKKLREPEAPLGNFFASGVLALREKLGPILWQLPPNFGFDPDRLRRFFQLVPRNTREAVELARRHDGRLKTRAWTRIERKVRPIRHCLEVRHQSFLVPQFFELLREMNVAFVFADTAGKWPYAEDVTADFIYIRLHGAEQLYVSGYDDRSLDWWANRIRCWCRARSPEDARLVATTQASGSGGPVGVYVYFDNDAKVHAPFDAQRLAKKLTGCSPVGPARWSRAAHPAATTAR